MKITQPYGTLDRVPWYYGYSYYEPDMDRSVFHPVPINIIVRAARWIEWRVRSPRWIADEREAARDRGRAEGFEAARRYFDRGGEMK